MDAGRPLTAAVAVRGGRLVSVGTVHTMRNRLASVNNTCVHCRAAEEPDAKEPDAELRTTLPNCPSCCNVQRVYDWADNRAGISEKCVKSGCQTDDLR